MRLEDGTLHLPTNPSPPTDPRPPRSLPPPPQSAGPETEVHHLPRPYRFSVRPSTSNHRAASSPTGYAAERVRVDVRLAAGPSARRGQGPECLSRAALLGAARPRQAQALHYLNPTDLRPRSPLASRNTFQQRNPLVASASLPARLPLPQLMSVPPAAWQAPQAPQAPQMPSPDAPRPLEGRFAAGSRAELSRLAAACEGALERQRERQEIEIAWGRDGDGQLNPDQLLALKYSGDGDGAAAQQQAAGGEGGGGGGRRRSSILLMRYQAEQVARQAEMRAPAEVRQAFAFFDVDGSGGLSTREFLGARDRL